LDQEIVMDYPPKLKMFVFIALTSLDLSFLINF